MKIVSPGPACRLRTINGWSDSSALTASGDGSGSTSISSALRPDAASPPKNQRTRRQWNRCDLGLSIHRPQPAPSHSAPHATSAPSSWAK